MRYTRPARSMVVASSPPAQHSVKIQDTQGCCSQFFISVVSAIFVASSMDNGARSEFLYRARRPPHQSLKLTRTSLCANSTRHEECPGSCDGLVSMTSQPHWQHQTRVSLREVNCRRRRPGLCAGVVVCVLARGGHFPPPFLLVW